MEIKFSRVSAENFQYYGHPHFVEKRNNNLESGKTGAGRSPRFRREIVRPGHGCLFIGTGYGRKKRIMNDGRR